MASNIASILSGSIRPAFVQVAALCVRDGAKGREVMLVKTLRTGSWVIPKGWPIDGLTLAEAAQQEAWEEAGVQGDVGENPIGSFSYTKIRKSGLPVQCRAQIFPLAPRATRDDYPEAGRRVRRWVALDQAAGMVRDPELATLLKGMVTDNARNTP